MSKHGTINWTELKTHKPDEAKEFYATALGWTYEGETMASGGTYWICKANDKPVAGILTLEAEQSADEQEHWFTYFAVDDIEEALTAARKENGIVTREPFFIPGIGTVAIVKAPTGSLSGWVQLENRS